jgi:hypothetical protein
MMPLRVGTAALRRMPKILFTPAKFCPKRLTKRSLAAKRRTSRSRRLIWVPMPVRPLRSVGRSVPPRLRMGRARFSKTALCTDDRMPFHAPPRSRTARIDSRAVGLNRLRASSSPAIAFPMSLNAILAVTSAVTPAPKTPANARDETLACARLPIIAVSAPVRALTLDVMNGIAAAIPPSMRLRGLKPLNIPLRSLPRLLLLRRLRKLVRKPPAKRSPNVLPDLSPTLSASLSTLGPMPLTESLVSLGRCSPLTWRST